MAILDMRKLERTDRVWVRVRRNNKGYELGFGLRFGLELELRFGLELELGLGFRLDQG